MDFDVIIVGAGHNGLVCAAYLADPTLFSTSREKALAAQDEAARGGKKRRVLVLERSARIGGACTLKTWTVQPDISNKDGGELVISPCAYLAGLLHHVVIDELRLKARGYSWTPADGGLLAPLSSGDYIWFHDDPDRCAESIARISPEDVDGWQKLQHLFDSVRDALRPEDPEKDMWLGEAPTRQQICQRLQQAGLQGELLDHAKKLLFSWSMAELLDTFFKNEKLKYALMGQGVIGCYASPFHPGTAYIYFHHMCGRMAGMPSQWGYVKGGMGKISEYIKQAAEEAGVIVRTQAPVKRIIPGMGVVLESGEFIRAPIVVSNADPRTALNLLGEFAHPVWQRKVLSVPMEGCVVKVNLAMTELPNFKAIPGTHGPQHLAQVNIPLESREEWEECYEAARRGELGPKVWAELYFQTAVDDSVCTKGRLHHVSAFVQYVPYTFIHGSWEQRKEQVKEVVLASLARHCSNIPSAVVGVEVMSPPEIEREIGLSGGHIFQGECLPPYMWANRLHPRTEMNHFYLCGAATHPGGSVIGCNGRNAAACILSDLSNIPKAKSNM
jgi:phytoene dehydrogenase-like protein